MKYDAYYAARDEIFEFIEKDAFGPITAEETLQDPPLDTYVCGILWPRGTLVSSVSPSEDDKLPNAKEETPDTDTGIELDEEQSDIIREANQFRPSVMAVSFALPTSVSEIEICFQAARYENNDKLVNDKSYPLREYRRIPLDTGLMKIQLPTHVYKQPLFNGTVQMQLVRRRQMPSATSLWTISFENTKTASQNEIAQNTSAVFQCQLDMHSRFRPIDNSAITSGDIDRQRQDFLYRKTRSYAVGHGCSAAWDAKAETVTEIQTTFLPKAYVSQMVASTDSDYSCFKMSKWSDEWKTESLNELTSYIQTYSEWGNKLQSQLRTVQDAYQNIAIDILSKIDECIIRLYSGIEVLANFS